MARFALQSQRGARAWTLHDDAAALPIPTILVIDRKPRGTWTDGLLHTHRTMNTRAAFLSHLYVDI